MLLFNSLSCNYLALDNNFLYQLLNLLLINVVIAKYITVSINHFFTDIRIVLFVFFNLFFFIILRFLYLRRSSIIDIITAKNCKVNMVHGLFFVCLIILKDGFNMLLRCRVHYITFIILLDLLACC